MPPSSWWRQQRPAVWASATLVMPVAALVVLAVVVSDGRKVAGVDGEFDIWPSAVMTLVPLAVAGALLIDRRPDLPFGWILAIAASALSISIIAAFPALLEVLSGNDSAAARWGLTATSLWIVPLALQGVVNVRFPSGRPSSRRGRALESAIVSGTVLVVLGGLFGATSLRDVQSDSDLVTGIDHPLTGGTGIGRFADQLAILVPIVILLGLVAGIGVVIRYRRAEGQERDQLRWRAAGVVVAIALFPIAATGAIPVVDQLDATVFVLTLVVPVIRHRLWDIEAIVGRSVAYTTILVVLAGVYASVVAVGASIASERAGAAVGAVAAVLAFAPLRDRTRDLVDRAFYGDRRDPYRTLSDLGRRLEATAAPGNAAKVIVETTATSLRLPYVAIENPDHEAVAQHGTPGERYVRWPISFEGAAEGHLVASPRRGEDRLGNRDQQLLADVARHAGAALHSETLTRRLLASRTRLVTAREEERRRMRRDLHDGLGPVLTAIGLNLDAARARLPCDAAEASGFLDLARQANTQAFADLRGLVENLRPTSLDALGLVGALQSQTSAIGANTTVHVDADALPALPAAVEVAAYRIASEAVHNAIRHANAGRCTVDLRIRDDSLLVTVTDDGSTATAWAPGVGLTAIRERVAELAGELDAGPTAVGGRLVARLPLHIA